MMVRALRPTAVRDATASSDPSSADTFSGQFGCWTCGHDDRWHLLVCCQDCRCEFHTTCLDDPPTPGEGRSESQWVCVRCATKRRARADGGGLNGVGSGAFAAAVRVSASVDVKVDPFARAHAGAGAGAGAGAARASARNGSRAERHAAAEARAAAQAADEAMALTMIVRCKPHPTISRRDDFICNTRVFLSFRQHAFLDPARAGQRCFGRQTLCTAPKALRALPLLGPVRARNVFENTRADLNPPIP